MPLSVGDPFGFIRQGITLHIGKLPFNVTALMREKVESELTAGQKQ